MKHSTAQHSTAQHSTAHLILELLVNVDRQVLLEKRVACVREPREACAIRLLGDAEEETEAAAAYSWR